jgi:hypothetical protein
MCRNIKPLFNFDPPATDAEIRDAALQYVRKLSGFNSPSQVNKDAFNLAITQISQATRELINSLETSSPHKSREEEAQKVRERNKKRFERK